MKKTLILLITLLFTLSFTSCNPTKSSLNEMSKICEKIENNFDKYTEK